MQAPAMGLRLVGLALVPEPGSAAVLTPRLGEPGLGPEPTQEPRATPVRRCAAGRPGSEERRIPVLLQAVPPAPVAARMQTATATQPAGKWRETSARQSGQRLRVRVRGNLLRSMVVLCV